ncbi:MAG TPA: SUMF1/EgtB/PvdO family nonheme iron enzyme, partial [Planctomycetota bacterium]|nr:SUMF1/EgtB/PvdO family nonheme iron enzyme [Planctomycetota bacterium]
DWGLARVLGRKDPHDIRIRTETAFSMTSIRTERREEREDAPDSPIVTMDGDVMGTPAYMPPEQARGEVEKLDPRSDVYSIGAMLYHLLTGQMPFVPPGTRMTNYTVLARLLDGPPKPVHEIRKDVPAELEAICEKAMARDAERRYPDTLALADDLRAYLEHRVVAAYETGALAEAKKWVQRNQSLAGAIAAALLIAIGGLAMISTVQSRANKEIEARNEDLTAVNVALVTAKSSAEHNERLARQRADDVLSLSAIQDLSDLIERADRLWPARPETITHYEAWLRDARALIEGRPADEANGIKAKPGLEDHRSKLAEIERRALPESGVDALEREDSRRRTWNFADSEDLWWHAQLSKLIVDLEAFRDSKTGLLSAGINPEHGWGMEKRLEFARTIEEKTISGAEAKERWAEAIASIRDRARCPKYDGLVIAPQVGLLPIGQDPASGLWEFAHIETGVPAERGADGKLLVKEETGLVFLLIPGGTFAMGAQGTDRNGENYDPGATAKESPVHAVTLAPYFLSKFEMTQGQWLRFMNKNRSQHGSAAGPPYDLVHPVETVSWSDCTDALRRLGLVLPTEAQWEYAARAGTTSVWWTGDEKETLAEACNLADDFAKAHGGGGGGWTYEEGLNDGYTVHAPAGSFRANPFGLHDVIGNLWEWCRDGYGGYDLPVQPGDGQRQVLEPSNRVIRGGGFSGDAATGRSGYRDREMPDVRVSLLGLRPACEIAAR